MAKTDRNNFLKQHVEKLVVAAAALAMIIVVVHWVISSSRGIELTPPSGVPLDKPAYSPNEVDDALAKIARDVEIRLQNVTPSTQPVPPYAKAFSFLAKQPLASPDSTMIALNLPPTGAPSPPLDEHWAPWGPGGLPVRPDSPISPTKMDLTQLAAALNQVAPKPPQVIIVQEVIAVPAQAAAIPPTAAPAPAAGAQFEYKEVLVAHLCGIYEFAQAQAKVQEELKKAYLAGLSFVYLNVEVERRDMLPSGQWSPPVAISRERMPLPTSMPTVPPVEARNLPQVYEAVRQLSDPAWQKEIVEPSWYSIMYPNRQWGSWCVEGHKPHTAVSDIPDTGGSVSPLTPSFPTPSSPTPGSAGPGGAPFMPGSREEMEAARRRAIMAEMGIGPGAAPPPRLGPAAPAPPPAGLPATPSPAAAAAAPKPVPVPSWQAQLNSGAVEYWAHDTRVLAGAYYQYRVRLALLNPMLGRNRELSSEADAKTIALLTPWSDWSAKTLAPRSTLIFLVGSDGTNVRLEVFTKKWGQMTRKEFMVRRGEAIGQDNVEKELQPLEGGDFKKVKVDFRTGAVAVDFDFEKKIIKNGIPLVTTEMIYLEPDGRLSSRIYDIDQSSQILKDMRALVVEPATVRPVTPPPPRPTTRATPPPPSPRPPGPPGPVRPF